MLFNSPEFIFGFVPLTLFCFFVAAKFSHQTALLVLVLASFVFYGWWNPTFVPLLLASIGFNYAVGYWIAKVATGQQMDGQRIGQTIHTGRSAKPILIFGIAANLTLLVYFKYAIFLLSNLVGLLGLPYDFDAIYLPLGISFFTFTQIAFLVDVYQGKAHDFNLARYGLFVTYYPHLIAGPILHHKKMMPQFARPDIFRCDPARIVDGLTYFILGLFKKVVLADHFGGFARIGFDGATVHDLSLFESWGSALSYTMQIYFDFSGYSDMAIGLALMIGVTLPVNFYSPYKARNMIEFWRRWHMTLSRFLRDYLYIPLGGNRSGKWRRHVNLMITMMLGGLWHGAGWTFLIWGALHGIYLVINHGWWHVKDAFGWSKAGWLRIPGIMLSWLLTFLAVVVAWVFFRAPTLDTALSILRGMVGFNGVLLPTQIIDFVPVLGLFAKGLPKVPYLADGTVMGCVEMSLMLLLGMVIVLAGPALQEMRVKTRYWLLIPCAALALQRVLYGASSEFLYFQF